MTSQSRCQAPILWGIKVSLDVRVAQKCPRDGLGPFLSPAESKGMLVLLRNVLWAEQNLEGVVQRACVPSKLAWPCACAPGQTCPRPLGRWVILGRWGGGEARAGFWVGFSTPQHGMLQPASLLCTRPSLRQGSARWGAPRT